MRRYERASVSFPSGSQFLGRLLRTCSPIGGTGGSGTSRRWTCNSSSARSSGRVRAGRRFATRGHSSRGSSKRRSSTGISRPTQRAASSFRRARCGRRRPSLAATGSGGSSASWTNRYRTMVGRIAASGLRVGELLALRWRALDLESGTLRVEASVFEGAVQTPKTTQARRTIPLGPHIVSQLRDHRERFGRRADGELVFPNRMGDPHRESKLLQRGTAAEGGASRARAGDVASVPPHSLVLAQRPSRAVKIAQEQLGHASIQTTLNIYTHVVDASHRQAVEAVGG